jgi:hypothetical protein
MVQNIVCKALSLSSYDDPNSDGQAYPVLLIESCRKVGVRSASLPRLLESSEQLG